MTSEKKPCLPECKIASGMNPDIALYHAPACPNLRCWCAVEVGHVCHLTACVPVCQHPANVSEPYVSIAGIAPDFTDGVESAEYVKRRWGPSQPKSEPPIDFEAAIQHYLGVESAQPGQQQSGARTHTAKHPPKTPAASRSTLPTEDPDL